MKGLDDHLAAPYDVAPEDEQCSDCGGSGQGPKCWACEGDGLRRMGGSYDTEPIVVDDPCDQCQGEGHEDCDTCGGAGSITSEEMDQRCRDEQAAMAEDAAVEGYYDDKYGDL